jgi:neutral ceramidase
VGLFLQGCGGDAKVSVLAEGERWRPGTWEDVTAAGTTVAEEVGRVLDTGLTEVEPHVCARTVETRWPLEPARDDAALAAIRDDASADEWRRQWAQNQLDARGRGEPVATEMPVTVQGVQLGQGLRLVGLEGEVVAELGLLMQSVYGGGITVPLGYCNGTQAYLPTSRMLEEGGYEAESAWEYGHPAALAKGTEEIVTRAGRDLQARGVG